MKPRPEPDPLPTCKRCGRESYEVDKAGRCECCAEYIYRVQLQDRGIMGQRVPAPSGPTPWPTELLETLGRLYRGGRSKNST